VALHDHSLLHACVRGLAGGHPDFAAVPPSASNSSAMTAAVPQVFSDSHLKSVLAPFAITEKLRKISDPSKFNHVPGMFAHAQNDATPLATQNMLSKLGISSSRVVAVKAPGTTSPSLSQKMQHDGGVDTLNQMQIGQLRGTHKTKLFNEECQAELLASARIAVQKHTAAPQRPMPGAVIDKAMDHGTLRRQLQRHTLFRPLGSPGITPVHAWASENASRIAEAELAEVEASRGGGLASSGKETVAEDVPSSSVPNVHVAAVTVTGQPDEVSGHVSKRQKQTLSSNEGCSSVHGGVAGQGIQARQDEFIEPSHAKRPIADADGQEVAPSKKKKLSKDSVTPNVSRSGRTTGSWKQPREW